MLSFIWIQLNIACFNCLNCYISHLRINFVGKRNRFLLTSLIRFFREGLAVLLFGQRIKIFLELDVGKLISLLVLAIRVTMFLNRIISQVYLRISDVINVKLIRWCSYITFSEEINFNFPPQSADHNIMPDVEFSILVEEGFLDVFLDNVS